MKECEALNTALVIYCNLIGPRGYGLRKKWRQMILGFFRVVSWFSHARDECVCEREESCFVYRPWPSKRFASYFGEVYHDK